MKRACDRNQSLFERMMGKESKMERDEMNEKENKWQNNELNKYILHKE